MAAESELERFIIKLLGNAQQFIDEMKRAGKSVEDESTKMEKFLKQLGQTALQVGTAIGLSAGLKSAFGEWTTAEHTAIKLEAALRANERAVGPLMDDYAQFATEIEKVTRMGDDAVLMLLKQAEGHQLSGEAAKEATKDAIALATATGHSAESAIRLVAAVKEGNIEKAMLYGKQFQELRGVRDEQEFILRFQRLVIAGWEAETKMADTAAGKLEQLKNQYGNLQEELGKVVAEGLLPMVEVGKDVVAFLQEMTPETKKAIVVTAALGAGVLAVVTAYSTLKTLGVISTLTTMITTTYSLAAANATLAGTMRALAFGGAFVAGIGIAKAMVADTAHEIENLTEKMREQSNFTKQRLEREGKETLAKAEAIDDPKARADFLKKEKERADKVVAIHKRGVDQIEDDLANVKGGKGPLAWMMGDPRREAIGGALKGAKEELAAAEKNARDLGAALDRAINPKVDPKLKKDIEEVTEKLRFQAETWGMSAAEIDIYRLKSRGATDAMIQEATEAQGLVEWLHMVAKAGEDAAKAQEKLQNSVASTVEDLESEIETFGMSANQKRVHKLLAEGASGAEVLYAQALADQLDEMEAQAQLEKELAKQREDSSKQAEKAAKRFDAAASNSVEARQRIQEFYNSMERSAAVKVGRGQNAQAAAAGGAEARERGQKQLDKLEQIRRLNEQQLNRPVVLIEPANLLG